jgi:hypothetical protein
VWQDLPYTLSPHMKSPIRSSLSVIAGHFPQPENNLVIFPIKLFVGRFLCAK